MSRYDLLDDFDDKPRQPAADRSRLPAVADTLWWCGVFQLLTAQLGLGLFLLLLFVISDAMNDRGAADILVFPAAIWCIGTPVGVLIILGARCARRSRRYVIAVMSALLTASSFPALPLAPVTIPIGVWALRVLLRREVRAGF